MQFAVSMVGMGYRVVWLGWADRWSPLFLMVSLLLPLGLPKMRRRWAVQGLGLIAAQTVCDLMRLPLVAGSAGALLVLLSGLYVVQQGRMTLRVRRAWLRRYAELRPLPLQLPFRGRWKALRCGPNPGRNHHLGARDQWFAVDFVRVDGASRGSEIRAPADGVVAYVEDGHADKPGHWWLQADRAHPAGNYVSIQVNVGGSGGRDEPAWVILAHLEQGSLRVKAGDRLRAGEVVGRCGNSGNTSIPHLHIHLQAGERVKPGGVWGLPIRFAAEGPDSLENEADSWVRPGQEFEIQ
ncbi:MAG: M23 family metallopeptidase [Acidobacteriaceae bacterium]